MKKLLLSFCLLFGSGLVFGQLSVNTIPNNQIAAFLQGNGLAISNLVVNCHATGYGMFNGINSNIGLNSGLILTTGEINGAPGPNNSSSWSGGPATTGSDPDLAAIAGIGVNDVCAIEFDAVPQWNNIVFNYVFASEEYPEFVCSSYNDAFALLVSGPGISGPYTNGARNQALIPGTNTPVAINSVNHGNVSGNTAPCDSMDLNWASYNIYYIDNDSGPSVQYDGFTTVLQANIILTAGQTYHFKIIVGDASDAAYDSAVLLKQGSFSSIAPTGIGEQPISNVGLYPNPAEEFVEINFDATFRQMLRIELVDLAGRIVQSKTVRVQSGQNNSRLDFPHQKEGIYFLRLSGENFQTTRRLVIGR